MEKVFKYIFVKLTKGLIKKINFDDIYFIKGAGDYSEIYFKTGRQVVHGNVGKMMNHLPKDQFFRCHRSHVVNVDKIDQIQNDIADMGAHKVSISATYKKELLQKLNYAVLTNDENEK